MHIYYHADFDGIGSSVLLMDFFSRRYGLNQIKIEPVDYKVYSNWKTTDLKKDKIAVVDFAFHPQASWWFDHHFTAVSDLPLFDPASREMFEGRQLWFNYDCKSCAGWIAYVLKTFFEFSLKPQYDELVFWADVIDSAGYKDVNQIISSQEPALQIETALRHNSTNEFMNLVAQELRYKALAQVAGNDVVQEAYQARKEMETRSLKLFGENILLEGQVAVFEHLYADLPHNRFFPYYYYPEAKYSAGIIKIKNGFKLEIGKNPWHNNNGMFNVGGFCASFGGGGHYNVGGIRVDSLEKARSIIAAALSAISSLLTEP